MIFHYYAYNVNLEKSLSTSLSLSISISISVCLFIYLSLVFISMSITCNRTRRVKMKIQLIAIFCNGECHMYSVPMKQRDNLSHRRVFNLQSKSIIATTFANGCGMIVVIENVLVC